MRFLPLLLLAGCIDFREERREDPFDRYERMPVGEGNIKITVELFEFDVEEATAFDAAFALRDRNVVVAGGGIFGNNGATVMAGGRDFVAAFRAQTEKYRSRSYTRTFQLVADGYEASLSVVDRVAAPVTFVVPITSGAVVIRTYEVLPTGTMLSVRPKKNGPLVDLEVTPVFMERAGRSVRITELTTRLSVEPGRPYVIMARDEARESFGSAFFSKRHGRSSRRVMQVLTVEAP